MNPIRMYGALDYPKSKAKIPRLLVLAAIFAGCGSSSPAGTRQPVKGTMPVATGTALYASTFAVGATYTNKGTGMQATVHRLTTGAKPAGLKPAPAGYTWELIGIGLRNTGKTEHSYSVTDFVLTNQNNRPIQAVPLPSSAARLKSGTLRPGASVAGTTAYQIPRSTTLIVLTWTDDHRISPPVKLLHYGITHKP